MKRRKVPRHRSTKTPKKIGKNLYSVGGKVETGDIQRITEATRGVMPPCYFCGGASFVKAHYIPTNAFTAAAIGTPPGKRRSLLYGACVECMLESNGLAEFTKRIEAKLSEELERRWSQARKAGMS